MTFVQFLISVTAGFLRQYERAEILVEGSVPKEKGVTSVCM
jgi:hypothetical protein